MSETSLIPPTPAEDEYVRAVEAATPLPLLPEEDPFALFKTWLREATASEPNSAPPNSAPKSKPARAPASDGPVVCQSNGRGGFDCKPKG